MITRAQIYAWRDLARRLELYGCEPLLTYDVEKILEICNGIGPSWFPMWLRAIIDVLNPTLQLDAAIHDMGFYNGNGTFMDFTLKNVSFFVNGCKLACYKYKARDGRRYSVIFKSLTFAVLCELFGWSAYKTAVDEL